MSLYWQLLLFCSNNSDYEGLVIIRVGIFLHNWAVSGSGLTHISGVNTYSSIGLDNGLTPNRWQAIIWTNDVIVHWRIYSQVPL